MSVMSDVFITITEGLDRGMATDEIAYALTCEYPSMDIGTALELIAGVEKFEQDYLTGIEL